MKVYSDKKGKSNGMQKSKAQSNKGGAGRSHDMSPKDKGSQGQAVWQNMREK